MHAAGGGGGTRPHTPRPSIRCMLVSVIGSLAAAPLPGCGRPLCGAALKPRRHFMSFLRGNGWDRASAAMQAPVLTAILLRAEAAVAPVPGAFLALRALQAAMLALRMHVLLFFARACWLCVPIAGVRSRRSGVRGQAVWLPAVYPITYS